MKHLSSILDNKDLITKGFADAGYEPKLPGAPITTPEIYFLNGNKQWVIISATGDMTKAVYDTNNNGAVDKADSILETRVGAIQKQWIGTKAQFDAIATKDPNTCYITTDEPTTSFVTLDNTLHIPITYIPSTIVEHSERTDNPHNVTKVQLGLDKVSNTSDAEKPVSTAVQGLLNLKAPLNGPVFTNRVDFNANVYFGNGYGVNGLLKSHVGLGNVDNTTDLNKPISTAVQNALNGKASIDSPAFTGNISFTNATSITGLTKTHIGLAQVDNTSDASKPISVATQTALDLKAPLANPTFTGTVNGITKAMVGLDKVDNTADTAKPISVAVGNALNTKAPADSPVFTGAVHFENATAVTGLVKANVGLGNVDNTTDLNKPISTAMQTALDLKAPLANPTFTGTVSGITKAMVGLGNVDNESKATMFVSPTFTGMSSVYSMMEKTTITDLAWGANQVVVLMGGGVYYSTAAATTNIAVNVRAAPQGYPLSALLQDRAVTFAFLVTNGATPYYVTSVAVDNITQTVKWVGGAPTSGNANAVDAYTFTIIRKNDGTYLVLGSRTKYA